MLCINYNFNRTHWILIELTLVKLNKNVIPFEREKKKKTFVTQPTAFFLKNSKFLLSPAGQNEILACVPGKVTACVYMPLLRVPEQARACWTNKPAWLYQQAQQIHEETDTKHGSCLTCLSFPMVDTGRGHKANPHRLTNASYVYWTQLNSSTGMACCEGKKIEPLITCLIWRIVSIAKQMRHVVAHAQTAVKATTK